MKLKFVALIIALLTLHAIPALSKTRCTPVYMFGVSASFNDSIVYFTDIQIIDSAWIEERGNMLLGRLEYSYQLRSFVNARGEANRTCLVAFAFKEKDIMKKYQHMKKQFTGSKKRPTKYDVREIDEDEFKFRSVTPDGMTIDDSTIDEKSSRRIEKSKAKKEKGMLKNNPSGADSNPDSTPVIPPRH